MKARMIACCVVAAALAASPAFAAGKKSAKGAAKGAAVATAAAPAMPAPTQLSTINAPTCKRGDWVTINGKKMPCQ
jgi:hypothetical protein